MSEQREAKQVIVINRGTDPKMRRGKEIAQGAHASMAWLTDRLAEMAGSYGSRFQALLTVAERVWIGGSFAKITCQVGSEQELVDLHQAARAAGLQAYLIRDAGRTEFGGTPTITALAIGPDWTEEIDKVTGHLKLY